MRKLVGYEAEVSFCFCKQETAYEMRISDWNSDVCSADHCTVLGAVKGVGRGLINWCRHGFGGGVWLVARMNGQCFKFHVCRRVSCWSGIGVKVYIYIVLALFAFRSEEHTSELQSLMRISYAGFCLKKTNTIQHMSNTLYKLITYRLLLLCEI